MTASKFIRAMHPKSEIQPTRAAIVKVLNAGWWGQMKIHGHRAQIHIPSNQGEITVYNRQGRLHAKAMPAQMAKELHRLFAPTKGINVLDAEWLKGEDRLFIFDLLCQNGAVLDDKTYADRYELLPRVYSSPHIETLHTYKSVESCLTALESPASYVEGLVFKAPFVRGFLDAAIVRCRRSAVRG